MTYAWLKNSLRNTTWVWEVSGRITRNQKKAPKPTLKIAASSVNRVQGTRTAAARIRNSAAAATVG